MLQQIPVTVPSPVSLYCNEIFVDRSEFLKIAKPIHILNHFDNDVQHKKTMDRKRHR